MRKFFTLLFLLMILMSVSAMGVDARSIEKKHRQRVMSEAMIRNNGQRPIVLSTIDTITVECDSWTLYDYGSDGELLLYTKDSTYAFYFDLIYGGNAHDLVPGKTYTIADMDETYFPQVFYDGQWNGLVSAEVTKTIDEKGLVHFVGSCVDSLDASFIFYYDEETVIASGTCGGNLTWTLTRDSVLTISGTGVMTNFEDPNHAPWYSYRSSIKSVVVADSVTSIGNSAFYEYKGLTSVTIPNSVTSIGNDAFYWCENLISVTIPNSVTSIGNNAFQACFRLTSVTLGNSVTSIGNKAFCGCIGLTSVTLGNSVTSIGDSAFYNCSRLTSVTIPNSVTSIGGHAFAFCSGLTSVTIGNSVTSIGEWAFYGCKGLTSVTIPNSVVSIGYQAFMACSSLTSVTIPNSVTSIGNSAFSACSISTINFSGSIEEWCNKPWSPSWVSTSYKLYINNELQKDITIPNSVSSIGNYAFYNCSGLTSVTIGSSVTSIGSNAFYNCSSLTSVKIGNNVTSIEYSAFESCTSLTSVTIPNSVTSIGFYAFHNCTGLTSVMIPSSVTEIGGSAFQGCTGLTSIVIPNGVMDIEWDTFSGCSSLTSVKIGNSVTSIGDRAFEYCTGLTSVMIPHSVTSIGEYAFSGCTGLTSVTIPNSVTSIGSYAFHNCTGLTSITNYATTPQDIVVNGLTFINVNKSTCKLYVPAGSINVYKNAYGWKDFTNILPISAQETETTSVQAEPTDNSVSVSWPQVSGAASYELVIKDKDGNVVCTLIFNAQGQLTSIAFHAPARENAPQQTQQVGFSFTVTGLDSGTSYDLTITAKNSNGQVIDKKDVTFRTNGLEPIENVRIEGDQPVKVYHEGQIYILRGEKVYTLQGQEVR